MDLRSKNAIESSKQHDIDMSNILIAEFMGYEVRFINKCYSPKYNDGTIAPMQFHKSWDWLMPVVEKIESYERYDVDILQYGTRISDNQKEIVNNIANISFDTKIDHTYQAVVKFIKQYNQNK